MVISFFFPVFKSNHASVSGSILRELARACVSSRARDKLSHVSKYCPGGHVYSELITKNLLHL